LYKNSDILRELQKISHYDLEIQPRKGLTLIWPAEWTHAHKGNLLNVDSKYIVTGWMHFPNKLNSLEL